MKNHKYAIIVVTKILIFNCIIKCTKKSFSELNFVYLYIVYWLYFYAIQLNIFDMLVFEMNFDQKDI